MADRAVTLFRIILIYKYSDRIVWEASLKKSNKYKPSMFKYIAIALLTHDM